MFTTYKNKRISTIYSVIPQNEADFMDEAGNYSFSEPQMKKLKKVMGFDKRRVALEGETVGDYAVFGIKQMIADGVFKEEEIGAIIVTTTSPDYFIPPTSNVIQGQFNFDLDTVCIDISQGCCGYIVGLNLSKFNTIAVMFDLRVNTTYIHNLAILVFIYHITCAIYCFRIMVV